LKKKKNPGPKCEGDLTSGKKQQISSIQICVQKKNSLIPTKKLPLLNIKQEDFLRWQIFFVQKKLKYLINILRELTIKNGFAINHQFYCIIMYTLLFKT